MPITLEPADLKRLTFALDDAYVDIQLFAEIILFTGRNIQNVAPDGTKRSKILTAIQAASAEMWLGQLLAEVAADMRFAANSPVRAEIARIQALLAARAAELQAAGATNPIDALKVFERPFIDRDTFRLDLAAFHAGNRSKVFVLKGPSAAGKTHTWFLVRHYCETVTKAGLALVDLSDREPSACEPRDLMMLLALQMNLDQSDLSRHSLAQDARIGEKLATWFIGKSRTYSAAGETWWIGFDGLDRPQAAQGALDLVSRLALAIETGLIRNTWLLLFGFEAPLAPKIDNFIFREPLSGVGPSEVRQHFRRLVERRGGTIDNDALDPLVSYVFEGMPAPLGHEHVADFGRRFGEVAKKLGAP